MRGEKLSASMHKEVWLIILGIEINDQSNASGIAYFGGNLIKDSLFLIYCLANEGFLTSSCWLLIDYMVEKNFLVKSDHLNFPDSFDYEKVLLHESCTPVRKMVIIFIPVLIVHSFAILVMKLLAMNEIKSVFSHKTYSEGVNWLL